MISLQLIGKSKVSKMNPKPSITYPFIRLPQECGDVIGNTVGIYETEHEGKRAFLLVIGDDTTISQRVIQPSDAKNIEKRLSDLENEVRKIRQKVM